MKLQKNKKAAEAYSARPLYINRGVREWHKVPTGFSSSAVTKVVIAVQGSFVADTDKQKYEVHSASGIVLPPGIVHRFVGLGGSVEMCVMTFPNLSPQWRGELMPNDKPSIIRLSMEDLKLIEDLCRRCQLEQLRDDSASKIVFEGLGQAWLGILVRAASHGAPSRRDSRLQKVRQIIFSRFFEPLRVGELARHAGMSEAHFRDCYRDAFGCSPKAEIVRLRLKKAQALLHASDRILADIAQQCGFCNEHEFSRFFHKYIGIPPGRWRKMG